ncbi:MAG: hypothetical protein ACLSUW_08160 [Akkermansia sp.]
MGQSRISTQLAQLRQEGVVEDARSGKTSFTLFPWQVICTM